MITWPTLVFAQTKLYAPILMYHHIEQRTKQNPYIVSPKIFDEQMAWLKENNFHVVSFADFYAAAYATGTLPINPVVITIDDGHRDQYTEALPILKKYGYTAMFYVVPGYSDPVHHPHSMTWTMIEDLKKQGMEVGAHSMTHPNLKHSKMGKVLYEVHESKKELEAHLGIPVLDFAYPGGDFNSSTVAVVRAAGFRSAVATWHSVYHTYGMNAYAIPRVHVDNDMASFKKVMQGLQK